MDEVVAFLRDNPMQGNFYEAVWRSLRRVCAGMSTDSLVFIGLTAALLVIIIFHISKSNQAPTP